MAGMQGKPLPKKLGIKAGHRVCLLGAPRTIVRRLSCDEIRVAEDLRHPLIDVAVLFVDRVADLEKRFADVAGRLHPSGGFWIAWPKKKRGSDITEEVVRRIALAAGMVDNKICTVGDSMAIRLVLRGSIRDAMAYRAEPPPISRRVRRSAAAARVVRASGAGSSLHRARARSTK